VRNNREDEDRPATEEQASTGFETLPASSSSSSGDRPCPPFTPFLHTSLPLPVSSPRLSLFPLSPSLALYLPQRMTLSERQLAGRPNLLLLRGLNGFPRKFLSYDLSSVRVGESLTAVTLVTCALVVKPLGVKFLLSRPWA